MNNGWSLPRCPYAKPNCEICFGTGYVCGRHAKRVFVHPAALRLNGPPHPLLESACCCSPGQACICTGEAPCFIYALKQHGILEVTDLFGDGTGCTKIATRIYEPPTTGEQYAFCQYDYEVWASTPLPRAGAGPRTTSP